VTLDEILSTVEQTTQAARVALWTKLALRAMRLACQLHQVNFEEIVKKELARP
jgi:hypothetical protein